MQIICAGRQDGLQRGIVLVRIRNIIVTYSMIMAVPPSNNSGNYLVSPFSA